MPDNMDQTKGRVKEAAGDLTDDERMQREGKLDQASGTAKEKLDQARDKVSDLTDRVSGDDK